MSDIIQQRRAGQYSSVLDTDTYLQKDSALDGVVDGKQGTISFWTYPTTFGGFPQLYNSHVDPTSLTGIDIYLTSDGFMHFDFYDSVEGAITSLVSTTALDVNKMAHFMASWDFAATTAKLALNGVVEHTPTPSDTECDYTKDRHVIGAYRGGGGKYRGAVSELYMDFTTYNDPAVAANMALFRTATGLPANLGKHGERPTGTPPAIYLSNRFNTFHINQGSGGDFAIAAGAVTVGLKSPRHGDPYVFGFESINDSFDTGSGEITARSPDVTDYSSTTWVKEGTDDASIVSTELVAQAGDNGVSYSIDSGIENHTVTCDLRNVDTSLSNVCLTARYVNETNYVIGIFSTNGSTQQLTLKVVVADLAVVTEFTAVDDAIDSFVSMSLICTPTSVALTLGANSIPPVNNGDHSGATKVGVRASGGGLASSGARWDDFVVTRS